MALIKSTGNMYSWCTHMHTHLRGACPHACPYCYVQAIGKRFGQTAYTGPQWLDIDQLNIKYGTGRTIFIEHAADLFADAVKPGWIDLILDHCRQWPENTYVFQTRNPNRALNWQDRFPVRLIIGTTIETNRKAPGEAPHSRHRAVGLMPELYRHITTRFVTIEPILDFDVPEMLDLIKCARPNFINIGADSKGHGLNEPTADKVLALIEGIKNLGIEIRQKTNLDRILSPNLEV